MFRDSVAAIGLIQSPSLHSKKDSCHIQLVLSVHVQHMKTQLQEQNSFNVLHAASNYKPPCCLYQCLSWHQISWTNRAWSKWQIFQETRRSRGKGVSKERKVFPFLNQNESCALPWFSQTLCRWKNIFQLGCFQKQSQAIDVFFNRPVGLFIQSLKYCYPVSRQITPLDNLLLPS